ncbi:MAG TPA: SAM-dependent methyltransferase, partial [Treponema sp.]|nr:SAM-dependent methyltransferase [Treponema sp.]
FNGQNFCFNGYLPVKDSDRLNKLKALENKVYKEDQTQLFIETPYRNEKMFDSIMKACKPQTRLCIACGITTAQEMIVTKTIADWKKTKKPEFNKIPAIFLLYK